MAFSPDYSHSCDGRENDGGKGREDPRDLMISLSNCNSFEERGWACGKDEVLCLAATKKRKAGESLLRRAR